MVESSKILTVSYGTFSCTLEGFDDSFGTMKAIAEYFRDLAADDRYFGAEPPTPDVQMLAKIAEREITRRVEARTEDGGIVLRADAPLAPAMPPKSERPDPVAAAAAAVVPQVATPAYSDPAPEFAETDGATAPMLQQDAGPEAEDISSTLVASGQAIPDTALTFDDMSPVSDDDAAATAGASDMPGDVPMGHHDADSIAAKLERIRSVVGRLDGAEDQPFEDDQPAALMPEISDLPDDLVADHEDHADAYDDLVANDPSETASEQEVDLSALVNEDTAQADAAEPAFDMPSDPIMEAYDDAEDDDVFEGVDGPDLSEFLESRSETEAEAEVEVEIEDEAEGEVEDHSAVESTVDDMPLVLTSDDKVSDEEDMADASTHDGASDTVASDDDILDGLSAKIAAVADLTDADAEPAQEGPAIRATLVRIPKEQVEAAEEADHDELDLAKLDGADDVDVDVSEATDTTSLSETQEQELLAELAELEREYAAPEATADLAEPEADLSDHAEDASDEIAAEDTPEAAKPRNQLPDTDDETMSHILSQTDEALNEPESSRRRSAIAHLKAAVAATEAARSLGDEGDDPAKTEEAFREDLNEVVRPKRPTRPVKPSGRTARPRPAPLKLVASQRIDAPQADAATNDVPVQPRRVASAKPMISEGDASSFAEFAEKMGASELPELLEAAAAYTAFVEGSEDFSRPQIMQKVQMTVGAEISREDGLRYFGTLLREGRISKVRSGRFAVAEDTRYRPSA